MKPIFEKITIVDGFEPTTTHIGYRYLSFFIDMDQGEMRTGFVTYPVYFADGISRINWHTYKFAKPTDASFEEFSESFKQFVHDILNTLKKENIPTDPHISSEDLRDLIKEMSDKMMSDISHFKGSKSWDSYDKLLSTSKALTPLSDWIKDGYKSSTLYTDYLN